MARNAQHLMEVKSPLVVQAVLASHLYHQWPQAGFQDWCTPLRSASDNMQLAHQNPEVIREYLQKELSLDRMLGPFTDTNSLPPLHINRFGVILNTG